MKFAVTSVQVTRQTRRRAGKSKTEIIDTDNDIYTTVFGFDEAYRPTAVERIYEGANCTEHTQCKVIDVRQLEDKIELTEKDLEVFNRHARFVSLVEGNLLGWNLQPPTLGTFVKTVQEILMSERGGLTEEYRTKWMALEQKQRTKILEPYRL